MKITNTVDVPKELIKIVAESYFTTEEQFTRQIRPAAQLILFSEFIRSVTTQQYKFQWQVVVKNFIRKYAGTFSHARFTEDIVFTRLELFNFINDSSREGVYLSVFDDRVEYGKIQSTMGVTSLVPSHEI